MQEPGKKGMNIEIMTDNNALHTENLFYPKLNNGDDSGMLMLLS